MKLTNPSSLLTNGLKLEYSYRVDDVPFGCEARVLKCGKKEPNWFYFLRSAPRGEMAKSANGYWTEFEALDALRSAL